MPRVLIGIGISPLPIVRRRPNSANGAMLHERSGASWLAQRNNLASKIRDPKVKRDPGAPTLADVAQIASCG